MKIFLAISCIIGSSTAANAGVTVAELGQMLLGKKTVEVTQSYLNYLDGGPTSLTTYGGYHPGIDYRARQPTPVFSPIDGIVEGVPGGPYGTLAIKKNGSETRIILLHMSDFWVNEGDKVQTGCALGKSGSVGTDQPHLHVEARVGRANGAWYFRSKNDTGVNKAPELIPPRYVLYAPFPCQQ